MRQQGLYLAVLLSALAGSMSLAQAAGCPCPKSQMVELYGSVSMFSPQLPGPRVHQPPVVKTPIPVSMTANPDMADITRAFKTPTTDRVANPLLWDPLFVQQ